MKKVQILRELPKCDTETQSEQMCWENGINRPAQHRVTTNLQFAKYALSAKCNKAKHNKMRSACINLNFKDTKTHFSSRAREEKKIPTFSDEPPGEKRRHNSFLDRLFCRIKFPMNCSAAPTSSHLTLTPAPGRFLFGGLGRGASLCYTPSKGAPPQGGNQCGKVIS